MCGWALALWLVVVAVGHAPGWSCKRDPPGKTLSFNYIFLVGIRCAIGDSG